MKDENQLTHDQLAAFAKNGSNARAWQIKSMAQELLRRRQWDAPPSVFEVSPAEQRLIEGLRAMQGERDAA